MSKNKGRIFGCFLAMAFLFNSPNVTLADIYSKSRKDAEIVTVGYKTSASETLEYKSDKASSLKFPFNKEFKDHIRKSIPSKEYKTLSETQVVIVNLPAYRLILYSLKEDGTIDKYSTPVCIGKGRGKRRKTPISRGVIYEKRWGVRLRYGKDYPEINIKKNDIIEWTATYDENGKPVGYKVPHDKMRGLGMKLWTNPKHHARKAFVIHSTTDEFTLNAFSSSGCLRVGMDDMLALYDLIAPRIKIGRIKKPVPVVIQYDLVELTNKNRVVLHANIYEEEIDLIEEFKKDIADANLNLENFDLDLVNQKFSAVQEDFTKTKKKILEKLSKNHPHNFLSLELKKQLHKEFELSDLMKSTSDSENQNQ